MIRPIVTAAPHPAPVPHSPPPAFRTDEPNRCQGCGSINWLVGRLSAECAVCGAVALITIPATPTRLED